MELERVVTYRATCHQCGAKSEKGDGSHLSKWLSVSCGPALGPGTRSEYGQQGFHLCPRCAVKAEVVKLLEPYNVWGDQ